ncbi:TnsD family transposase [Virgibacillus flavescens]|uniref:TnsD family transposase n=1 Tax=Virgibacillus flavescens TaxID=1611422 RepID=UPI003D32D757
MILQFPTPYPGELLYSTIGRYHLRSGNVFLKHTLEDLFGKRTITASALLPSGIHSLIRRLPESTTIDEKMLIDKHTMYPFYSAFLGEKAKSIYQAMLSEDGKAIYMQSGIMASSIPQNKHFKYCPACFKEALNEYGELYWQRLHQFPGQLICQKHRYWLENSTVPINHSNKHSFLLPTLSNCDLTKENKVDENTLQQYVDFLRQAEQLLDGNHKHKDFIHFTDFYRKHLIENGFASINGKVFQERLHEAFRAFYPDRFLDNLHANVKSKDSWLASITRKHRKSFHPFYHILLLNFLGLDVNDVFQATSLKVEPFGKPHWPCLNIVCPRFRKDVIRAVSIRICEKTKEPIGRFSCKECGFTYTRKGLEQNVEDRFRYTRIMDFGFLWKKELSSLIEDQLSYREIARRLHADPNTVIKYAKAGADESRSKEPSDAIMADSVERNRQIWLKLQDDHPNLSKTEMRNQKPSTYAFLYRNDKEWLHNNSPTLQKRKSEKKRVNWKKRDVEILDGVKKATRELRNRNGRPKRITIKSIAVAIGERAVLEQHLDKMPKTKVFINNVWESDKEFRLRRVEHVIQEMREAEDVIKAWKVLRMANIKTKFINEVTDYIEEQIKDRK